MNKKKKVVKKKAVKKVSKKANVLAASAGTLQSVAEVTSVLKDAVTHIIELLRASFLDSFRQWVLNKLEEGFPISIQDFIDLFRSSYVLLGLSEEKLLSSLDDETRDRIEQGKKAPAEPVKGVIKAEKNKKTPEKEEEYELPKEDKKTSVFKSLGDLGDL